MNGASAGRLIGWEGQGTARRPGCTKLRIKPHPSRLSEMVSAICPGPATDVYFGRWPETSRRASHKNAPCAAKKAESGCRRSFGYPFSCSTERVTHGSAPPGPNSRLSRVFSSSNSGDRRDQPQGHSVLAQCPKLLTQIVSTVLDEHGASFDIRCPLVTK